VEIQGAGEGFSFSRRLLDELLDLAERGIALLIEEQRRALGV
jgi:ribonuclease PH